MRLELHGVTKSFESRTVLDNISFAIDTRSVVLIGPSGGGKSTLLRIIAGLETPDSGTVQLNGETVDYSDEGHLRQHRRNLGVVFQAFNLFPHLSAIENITLPLVKVHGHSAEAAHRVGLDILERFRLGDHAHKQPAQLSGGQKQRVAIARALAVQPSVLIFDEPTSALDPEMTAEVLETIEQLKREGRDLLLATHEMGFARIVGDYAIFVAEGRIAERATANDLFSNPTAPECQNFLARVLKY
jgi:polar amino acid transport system ATP-binding protein